MQGAPRSQWSFSWQAAQRRRRRALAQPCGPADCGRIAALLAACSAPEWTALPAESVVLVLVLGDSLSFGTDAGRGEDYPSLLAESTGWAVVNAGVPGDTSASGLQRLPELLEEHEPDLLLVELGGNDFLRRIPARETEANLKLP